MPDIEIDTSSLTLTLITLPEAGIGPLDGSTSPPPRVSLDPGTYHLRQGDGPPTGLVLTVTADGTLDYDPAFDAVADGRGTRRLTLRGVSVRVDGTALSHDLLPMGPTGPQPALPRATVNTLTLLPGNGYGFAAGPDLGADLRFDVEADGQVTLGSEYAGFASAEGHTLVLRGHPVVLDASGADSDLVGLANIAAETPGPAPARHGPREILLVLLPARGYLPQTAHGVLSTGFDVLRDGTVTFPSLLAGRYSVVSPTTPHPSEEGQEFTIEIQLRPTDPDVGAPRGTVVFTFADGQALGAAELDGQGRARLTTAALPPGDHVIVAGYAGSETLAPVTTTIPHRVEARRGEPVADAALPEALEWALLPTLALMADAHAVDGRVKLAQALLNAAGAALPPLVVDGNFGALTEAAVRGFRGMLLSPGDVIDTPVWCALAVAAPFPLLEPGPRVPPMTGPPVALVQGLLVRAGATPPLDIDGRYGPPTESAVRTVQTARGLAVTGTVTPETWAALAVPPPAPPPSPSPAGAMRLTFSYDSADWIEGGPLVRFVSREDLTMTPPLGEDPDDSPQGRSGFWYEVQDGRGQVLYRRGRHRPIEILPEIMGDGEGAPARVLVDAPRGVFELVAPVLPGATAVVLFSSPPDPARLHEPAAEIFSLPLSP